MDSGTRKSGIEALGRIKWGTHICLLYETEADLLKILAAYVKAGLDQGEFCLWITSGEAQQEAVKKALLPLAPDLDKLLTSGRLEMVNQQEWYFNPAGQLDLAATAIESKTRLEKAMEAGATGMRLAGSGHWRSRTEWEALLAYEKGINRSIDTIPVISICCYPLVRLGPMDIAAVVSTHHIALVKQAGRWAAVENSDHNETRERARKSEEKYRRVFETAANLITSVDKDWIIVDCNKRVRDVLGYKKSEIIGQHMGKIMHPDCHEAARSALAEILERGYKRDHEYRMVRKDGRVINVMINSSALTGVDGRNDRTFCIISDVTETLRLRELATRAEKMKAIGTLAGGIAHDFNNLLGVITGNVSFALQNLEPGHELCELLTDVWAGASRAQSLTQQLLTFAEGGEPIKEPTALPGLVKEAATQAAAGTNIRCEFQPLPGLPMAYVDPGQVTQMVHNLVSNTAQAMPDGGLLRIWFDTFGVQPGDPSDLDPGRYLVVNFQDEGPGIPEEHLDRIFEPYYTTRQKSQGLGLATVFSVASRHGGKVTVSSPPGEGAIFRIYLPSTSTVEVYPTDQSTTPLPRRRVLVMDDQLPVQRMVSRILKRLGMECEVAADGASAVDLYRAAMDHGQAFDLVILDLTIPAGMGGREAIQQLREMDPEVRAVVSSGYANDPVMARYQEHGFAAVLAKPYTFKQFQGLLQDMFDAN